MIFSRLFLMCTLIGISSIPLIYLQSEVVPEDSGSFLGEYQSPSETPDPIDVDTNNVTKRYDLTQLILKTVLSEKVIVKNDGQTILAALLNNESTKSTATGSVLMKDNYILKEILYLWTDDIKKVAGTTINGKGFALKNIFTFFNEKYETFDKALNHRDGLVEMGLGVNIGSVINKEFDRYAKILKQIQEAGTESMETSLNTVISWCLGKIGVSPNTTFYAYPGSYLKKEKNMTYYSATAIVLPMGCQIDKNQFKDTFGSARDDFNEPLTNPGKQYPQNMPVVQAKGVEIKNEI